MTIPERYLRKVGFWLPSSGKRALIERIRTDLEEHLEDLAEPLGRPLSADEVEEGLRDFGSPPVVATRYSPEAPLISGGLMVAYWRVLTLACSVVIGVQVVLLVLAFSKASPGTHGAYVTQMGNQAVYGLLMAFTSITIVFAVLSHTYAPRDDAGRGSSRRRC